MPVRAGLHSTPELEPIGQLQLLGGVVLRCRRDT